MLSVLNRKESADAQKQIEVLDKQYKMFCESLNALKRQIDNTKGKPKETTDLTSVINQLDKSVDDMSKEVEEEKKQEQEMFKKLYGKKKKNVEETF
jgi:cell division protein ZapA (FtsZ GTPase activity inhibitor)